MGDYMNVKLDRVEETEITEMLARNAHNFINELNVNIENSFNRYKHLFMSVHTVDGKTYVVTDIKLRGYQKPVRCNFNEGSFVYSGGYKTEINAILKHDFDDVIEVPVEELVRGNVK